MEIIGGEQPEMCFPERPASVMTKRCGIPSGVMGAITTTTAGTAQLMEGGHPLCAFF